MVGASTIPFMSSDIIARIESSSWSDLEQIVKRNEIGIRLSWLTRQIDTKHPYFLREVVSLSYALHAGPRINEHHDLKIDFPGTIITPSYVPGFVVDTHDVKFCLHGIRHTKTMRNLVHESFGKAPGGVAIVMEPGMQRLYPKVNGYRQTRRSEYQFVPDEIAYADMKGITLFGGTSKLRMRILQKRLEHLVNDRTVTVANVPIGIESFRLPHDLERAFVPHIFSKPDDHNHRSAAVTMLRSLAEYCFLIEIAKYTNAKEVHGLYGLFHELDIGLFMRHPDIACFSIQETSDCGYVPAVAYEKDEIHIDALADVAQRAATQMGINFALGYGAAVLDHLAGHADQPLSFGLGVAAIGVLGYATVRTIRTVRRLRRHINRLT